jgi:hypothetical protein
VVAMQLLVPMRLPSTLRACCPGSPPLRIPHPHSRHASLLVRHSACSMQCIHPASPMQCNALGLHPYAGAFECNCRFWAAYLNPVYWSIYGLVITQLGSFSNESITGESC